MDTEAYSYDSDLIQKISSIEFNIWGNDEILRGSALGKDTVGVDIPDLYDNQEPKRGGLIDARMGTTSLSIDCATCGLNNIYCVGHFGHISLSEPVFNMGFLAYIKKILSCICLRCSKLLIYKNEKEIMEMVKNKTGKSRLAEIRNIVKNVTYCQKANYGCGAPVSKIKSEIKKSTGAITLYSEPNINNSSKEEGGETKKRIRQILTPDLVYDILKNISDTDCMIMGIDPTKSRPEVMIHKIFPVPPVAVRPSVKADFIGSGTMEDDLTHKLADIVKANIRIAHHKESKNAEKYGQDHLNLLQYHIASYQDSDLDIPKSEQKGKITKSLAPRLKGKEGRIRGNLQGKRIDFSARSVITSDPTISINQLGVPVKVAMNLTFPEVVTPQNIEWLSKLVRNGRDVYPGANFVFPHSTMTQGQRVLPIFLRFRKEKVELHYGDIVERHLMDGDIVLLNRQPSLHKLSMMGHHCKIINDPNLLTLRLNVAVTTPYNADFDGDEMNIFLPQSIQTQIELEEITDVKRQLITPATSRTIIGIVQDGLIGAYNLTSPNMNIDWKTAMNIMSYTSIDDFKAFKKGKDYTGHELFSMIIPPKINVVKGEGEMQVIVRNGKFEKGRLTKDLLGSKQKNNLTQLIWDEYGIEPSKTFLDNTQRLINNFNLYNGFTVGIGDATISKDVDDQINRLFETKDIKVAHMITELEDNPDLMDIDLFERRLFSELNVIREDVSKLLMDNLNPANNFNIMISSKSKGEPANMAQMAGCVGLQAFEGKLIPKKLNRRTLPYFFRDDDQSTARGLIKRPFINGMTFPEFFFHNMTGREGLIDQAIKSVTGDTPIIILDNYQIKYVMIGEWIDKLLDNNKNKIKHYKEREMELLNLTDKVYIPTCDKYGNVSWGEVSAITRHDPGKELYEIKTLSGRKVIVTESKSLLIWNKTDNKFIRTSTSEVRIGDYVPVTMQLSKPPKPSILTTHKLEELEELNKDNVIPDISYISSDEFIIKFLKEYFMNGCHKGETIEVESSCEIVNKINILCSRLGIFGNIYNYEDKYKFIIKGKWMDMLMQMITSYDEYKINLHYQERGCEMIQNDVILDSIIEINKIDINKYPKVYDLTVPDTLNFGLANGLHVVDTAESGYTQRKLIKSMEDSMIRYDCTVRTASNCIIQYVYGDSGADTTKQYEYNMKIIEMNNNDIMRIHKFTDDELKKFTNFTEKDNEEYYQYMLSIRDLVRISQIKTKMNYITIDTIYMLPINIMRIINNNRYNKDLKYLKDLKVSSEGLTPRYVLDRIDYLLENSNTQLLTMTQIERKNKSSIKYKDDRIAKTGLSIALHDSLSPKRCIIEYQLNKLQFDSIIDEIIMNYNKNLVEPGEMVGIIAAQSISEPLTQLTLNSFHHSGIASISSTTQGVPRIKELLSLTKNLKTPQMIIYLTKEYMGSRDMANKIASYIKYTTLYHIRNRLNVYYDPDPYRKGGFMEKDNVTKIFTSKNVLRNGCQTDINVLPWLIRIELNRESLFEKEVTLLDIKSKFCNMWERKHADKTIKKEERRVLERITQVAIISNTDYDKVPIIHIRFNIINFDINIVNDFIDHIIDKLKLKGISSITDISAINEERTLTFDNEINDIEKSKQYVIYTAGSNLYDIRYLNGIDINKTICNDVITIYETFGIEAARASLLREITYAYKYAGSGVNYHHISVLIDQMTFNGYMTSVDRHGMNKSDVGPLTKASFEKTVDHLQTAAMFGEVDHMNGVSSRIMTGLVVKGGTGLCNVILDTDMIQNSEFTEDIGQKYVTTYNEISENNVMVDLINKPEEESGMFIPL